jgi:hypothetical protein
MVQDVMLVQWNAERSILHVDIANRELFPSAVWPWKQGLRNGM